MRRIGAITMLLFATLASGQSSERAPLFPTAAGTYWVYEGEVTFNLTPNERATTTVRMRMQVAQALQGAGYRAALLKGGPWDLESYTPKKDPGDYLVVVIGEATYRAEGRQAKDIFEILRESGLTHEARDILAENIWFRTPLRMNGQYCPPDQLAREDRMYCWAVVDVETKPASAIAGAKPGTHTAYELTYRTTVDQQLIEVVPGIGITQFEYRRQGNPEVKVRLVEYHAGKSPSR